MIQMTCFIRPIGAETWSWQMEPRPQQNPWEENTRSHQSVCIYTYVHMTHTCIYIYIIKKIYIYIYI